MIFCSPWYRPCNYGIVVRSIVLSYSSCKLFYIEYKNSVNIVDYTKHFIAFYLRKASAQMLEDGCVIDGRNAAYEFDFGIQPTGDRRTESIDINVVENEAVLHAKFIDNDDDVFQIVDKDLRAGDKVSENTFIYI